MPNQYTLPVPIADRLWPRLVHEDTERVPGLGPCWIWPGAKNAGTGYGYIVVKQQGHTRHVDVHRLAYQLVYGTLPSSLVFVCHRCDVRLCCRPSHLFAGTQADNMRDMQTKGRGAIGDRNGTRLHPERVCKGTNRPEAKLTEAIVVEMRHRYEAGNVTQLDLAIEAGVERSVIGRMLRRQTWKHV